VSFIPVLGLDENPPLPGVIEFGWGFFAYLTPFRRIGSDTFEITPPFFPALITAAAVD